jgi:hypothetical protein
VKNQTRKPWVRNHPQTRTRGTRNPRISAPIPIRYHPYIGCTFVRMPTFLGLRMLLLVGRAPNNPTLVLARSHAPNQISSSSPPHMQRAIALHRSTTTLHSSTVTMSLWCSPRRLGVRRPSHPPSVLSSSSHGAHLSLCAPPPSSTTAPRLCSIVTMAPWHSPWRPSTHRSSHRPMSSVAPPPPCPLCTMRRSLAPHHQ